MIPHNVAIAEDGSWIIPVSRRPLPKRNEAISKIVAREQRGNNVSAARAQAILPATLLQKKLGRTTYRLWCALLTLRNDECETHPSLGGMARAAGISERQARKSLERLREFQLVEDFGFMYRVVPCRCDPSVGVHEHKVYIRSVYGLLRSSADLQEQTALVPRETARLVKAAAGQGGARSGAGRPKGKLDSAPRQTIKRGCGNSKGAAYKYQELAFLEEPKGSSEKRAVSQRVTFSKTERAEKERQRLREAWERFKAYTPASMRSTSSSSSVEEASMASTSLIQHKAQPSAVSVVPSETRAAPAAPSMPEEAAPSLALVDGVECDLFDLLTSERDAREIGFGGGYKGPRQRYTPEDMRASTALSSEVVQLRLPAPPRVREEHSDGERLMLLKAAYRAAHEKTLRSEYWRPAKAQTARERELMLEAAGALLAEGINPTSWARFSFYQWQRMGKKTAPSPKWVWSAARIHEHANWCREAIGGLENMSTTALPAAHELMVRLHRLRGALGWGRPTEDVVSEILPVSERRQLLQQQAAQREAWQRNIQQRIRNGEWVWG